MKKLIVLLLSLVLFAGCTSTTNEVEQENQTTPEPTSESTSEETTNVFTAKSHGYGGEMEVEVTFEEDQIKNIEVLNHHETNVVSDRALPILIERILEANTPVVDSVSAATFTSYALKSAVADAMSQNGLEVESISFDTAGPEHTPTDLEDVVVDIVVVGAGPSGLAASISAKQTNPSANVMLIEKVDILSGNGKFDLNFYDHFNSQGQADNGRSVTMEDFLAAKESVNETPERLNAWATYGNTLDAWLRNCGVELNYPYGGEKSMSHLAESDQYAGEVVQAGLEQTAYDLGVTIVTGTQGNELIVEDNAVVGVHVTNNDLESYNIMADAVILSTGGYSNNTELLAKYAPGSEEYKTSNQLGTTGDFVNQFEELGYSLIEMDNVRLYPTILSTSRDLTSGADVSFTVNAEGVKANSSMNEQQFYITDAIGIESFYRMVKHNDKGYYTEYASIEELATDMGIDSANLQTLVDEYNASEDKKREFASDGIVYVAKVHPAIHMTKGGVETNEFAQVLTAEGEVVDGLFASGEVTYQSGGFQQSTVFGVIAGENAAKNLD